MEGGLDAAGQAVDDGVVHLAAHRDRLPAAALLTPLAVASRSGVAPKNSDEVARAEGGQAVMARRDRQVAVPGRDLAQLSR